MATQYRVGAKVKVLHADADTHLNGTIQTITRVERESVWVSNGNYPWRGFSDMPNYLQLILSDKEKKELKKKNEHDIRKIPTHPMVEKSWLSSKGNLLVITKPITFRNTHMGKYLLHININNFESYYGIRIDNIDWFGPFNCPHPGVGADFRPHLCGISSFLTDLGKNNCWFEVVDAVILFLQEAVMGEYKKYNLPDFKRKRIAKTERSVLWED